MKYKVTVFRCQSPRGNDSVLGIQCEGDNHYCRPTMTETPTRIHNLVYCTLLVPSFLLNKKIHGVTAGSVNDLDDKRS